MKDGTIKPREKAEKKQETDSVNPPEISRFDKINEETFALTRQSPLEIKRMKHHCEDEFLVSR